MVFTLYLILISLNYPALWHTSCLLQDYGFYILTQLFLSSLCLTCLCRFSLCCNQNFYGYSSHAGLSCFVVAVFNQEASLVCKWLKYNNPCTFFFYIFYYLVAIILKICGCWLTFCPSVLTAQRVVYLSVPCPCSPKNKTWECYEVFSDGEELLLTQINAQDSGFTSQIVGKRRGR